MHRDVTCEMSDCSEFRQTIQGRAPATVHAAALLLILLLFAAVTWAALVEADLVVQAPGRLRPASEPSQVFTSSSPHVDGRVAEVCFREGEEVTRGQILLRLNTEHLDNEIEQRRQRMETTSRELAELERLQQLLLDQYASAQTQAQAELTQAEQELRRSKLQQASQISQATAEWSKAKDRLERCRSVAHLGAISKETMVDAETRLRVAEEQLRQARLPLDVGRAEVLRAALETIGDDFGVRLAELRVKKVAKQGEMDVMANELASLSLAKEQATLVAPVDGVVVSSQIDVGDVLSSGKPAVDIAPHGDFRFEVTVASSDIGGLEPGMSAKIKFDAYDYQKYGTLDGTVCFISPDSRVASSGSGASPATAPPAYIVRVELDDREIGESRCVF